ncbi:hypothetical protein [Mucilaginibacter sp.]|uniref:hypothetical protein n=1 Tax=Mucilaginibacter sp. TaxID=1882438 RepID=UPI0035BC191E
MKLDKVKGKLNKVMMFKLIEMTIFCCGIFYLVNFADTNWQVTQLSVAAISTIALLTLFVAYDIKQLIIITQLQRGYNSGIAPLQKKIEQLKLTIVTYVKFTLLMLPLYPVLLLLAGKIFFNIDFLEAKRQAYFITNAGLGAVFLIMAVWFFRQLSSKNINNPTAKILLAGSGWYQANSAYKFLKEIENFENEA